MLVGEGGRVAPPGGRSRGQCAASWDRPAWLRPDGEGTNEPLRGCQTRVPVWWSREQMQRQAGQGVSRDAVLQAGGPRLRPWPEAPGAAREGGRRSPTEQPGSGGGERAGEQFCACSVSSAKGCGGRQVWRWSALWTLGGAVFRSRTELAKGDAQRALGSFLAFLGRAEGLRQPGLPPRHPQGQPLPEQGRENSSRGVRKTATPTRGATWSCRPAGPRGAEQTPGTGGPAGCCGCPATCFPAAAGRGSRRAQPHVSWPGVSATACPAAVV